MMPGDLFLFLVLAGMLASWLVSRVLDWIQDRIGIPTPEESERRRLKFAEQCIRRNERLERDAAKAAWVELKARVVTAIEMNKRVQIAPENTRHLDFYNAELAKRGWVLAKNDPRPEPGVGYWFDVKALPDLPIPAAVRVDAENLPLTVRAAQ